MDWDKIFVLAKCYMDQVNRYYINYASTTLGAADYIGLTFSYILQSLIN